MPGPESARANARTPNRRDRQRGVARVDSAGSNAESTCNDERAEARLGLVRSIAGELSLRERLVVCLRFVDGLTLEEIAIVLNARTAEIDRILNDAIRRARRLVAKGSSLVT